ncbi:DUF6559 family protein [Vreelandella titanicae]|uniref:DUF6559 family protein n=1 Tax=Halomonadaceae TaxID=28256 RepID=UPI0026AA80C8
MGLLDNFKKKRAIKSYIEKLHNVLVNDYGRQKYYTQLQVKRIIDPYCFSRRNAQTGCSASRSSRNATNARTRGGTSCRWGITA